MTLRVPPAPGRQRMEALAHANDIRITRAALKRELRALPRIEGRRHLAAILDHPPEFLATATVYDVLQYPRGMGDKAARSICARSAIRAARRLGTLTSRECDVLAYELRVPDVERRAA